jgi:3-mercaptopyruvate sulfurtransferase SseA
VSFENVFSAAELEFYKENSSLRATLDNLTTTTLFPGARNTDPKEYRSEQADGKVRVPTQQLKDKASFDTWIQSLGIDKNTQEALTKQYGFYSKIAVN